MSKKLLTSGAGFVAAESAVLCSLLLKYLQGKRPNSQVTSGFFLSLTEMLRTGDVKQEDR